MTGVKFASSPKLRKRLTCGHTADPTFVMAVKRTPLVAAARGGLCEGANNSSSRRHERDCRAHEVQGGLIDSQNACWVGPTC